MFSLGIITETIVRRWRVVAACHFRIEENSNKIAPQFSLTFVTYSFSTANGETKLTAYFSLQFRLFFPRDNAIRDKNFKWNRYLLKIKWGIVDRRMEENNYLKYIVSSSSQLNRLIREVRLRSIISAGNKRVRSVSYSWLPTRKLGILREVNYWARVDPVER